MSSRLLTLLLCLPLALAACGAAPPAAATDSAAKPSTADTATTVTADTPAAPDSALGVDSQAAADSPPAAPDLTVADAAPETTPPDAVPDSPAPDSAPTDTPLPADTTATCPKTASYNYSCDKSTPGGCAGGTCILALCLAPELDPKRWDSCGDSVCSPCEAGCPADCGPKPTPTGAKQYGGDKTITVWVHGFSNQGADKLAKLTYGDVKGCGDVLQSMQGFGVNRPCGNTPQTEKDPTQLISVEYYGSVAPSWMTKQDIAEVEQYPYSGGPTGLQRYGRIVAKFAKWRMALSGATHVQFACHSMGCLITRQLIENDEEQLASQQKIVRWATSTGVVSGAKLAKLFNNPIVENGAKQLGLELSDFILMNPDYVWDTTVAWDHKLHAANNPLLGGILIHHVGATKPQIAQAMNIGLLDLLGASAEPNDGIMWTEDQYFWSQDPSIAAKSVKGEAVPPGLTLVNADHMTCPSTDAAGLAATAALFHSRKLEVRLTEFTLLDDREKANLLDASENGTPPAEVVVETALRFNPYVLDTFKKDVLVSDDRMATRTAPLWSQKEGETLQPNQLLVQTPVLDGMQAVWLAIDVIESDLYPKYKLTEWAFDDSNDLVLFQGSVPLQDGYTFEAKSKYGVAKFKVRIHQMY